MGAMPWIRTSCKAYGAGHSPDGTWPADRTALDMIVAGHLGALICVGDTENVLAAGNDGFPLNISFTSNRLFELSKMDGAIVIDGDLTRILRANFHLNPDPRSPRVRRACVTVLPLACRCSPMPS